MKSVGASVFCRALGRENNPFEIWDFEENQAEMKEPSDEKVWIPSWRLRSV